MNRVGRLGRYVGGGIAAFVVLSFAAQVRAHFLFIRIGTQAEAGRSAEVYFSEQAEAGDPRFIAKVAHTKLWIQTRPGEFRELRCIRPPTGSGPRCRRIAAWSVVGECEYGVLARPNQTPFLLRYYPKAVAGIADELNRLTPQARNPLRDPADLREWQRRQDKTELNQWPHPPGGTAATASRSPTRSSPRSIPT